MESNRSSLVYLLPSPSLPSSLPAQVCWVQATFGISVPPCVLFSTDPCCRSRNQVPGEPSLWKREIVCVCVCVYVCSGGVGVLEAMGEQRAAVWGLNESHASFPSPHPLLYPSLVIQASMTWMNNRDVQWYRLPCR